jgi:uncharacterized protein (TIGR02145 family)
MKKISIFILSLLVINSGLYAQAKSSGKKSEQTVTIGNQIWSTKNLNVDKFRNGDPIPQVKKNDEWAFACENKKPAWCYLDNDPANGPKHGKLYNWYAVIDPRGLAPEGWHIPSQNEWKQLAKALGGEDVAGEKLKSSTGWKNKDDKGKLSRYFKQGTNESGFTALPSGQRFGNGNFTKKSGHFGRWWSSTENIVHIYYGLFSDSNELSETPNSKDYYADYGYSVRLIKD